MIRGLDILLALRQNRQRPQSVWLEIGTEYCKPVYAQEFEHLHLLAEGNVKTDDFRPFVGLDVILYAAEDRPPLGDCLDGLKKHAAFITVLCPDYAQDIGWEWAPKWGDRDIGQIRWAEQFEDARKMCCRTDAETAERVRLEKQALEKAPWIRGIENAVA